MKMKKLMQKDLLIKILILIDSNFDFNDDDDDNTGVIYCFRTGCSRFVPG